MKERTIGGAFSVAASIGLFCLVVRYMKPAYTAGDWFVVGLCLVGGVVALILLDSLFWGKDGPYGSSDQPPVTHDEPPER